MWQIPVEALAPIKIGTLGPGRFVLAPDEQQKLQLFATVVLPNQQPNARVVCLTGPSAFRLRNHVSKADAILLPWTPDQLRVELQTGATRSAANGELGRLVIPSEIPPFFVATWSELGKELGSLERICLKTWTVEDFRVFNFGFDQWALVAKEGKQLHHLFSSVK